MARIEINGLTITGGGINLIGNTIGGEVTIDGERIKGDRLGQVIITGRRRDKK